MTDGASLVADACQTLGVSNPRFLAQGGQKVVCVVDAGPATLVLKVIALSASSPDGLPRAHREVELLQDISSPHVVQVRSQLVELGDPVVGAAWLEEHLDGTDLSQLFGSPWAAEMAVAMARDVAQGLGELHARQVVHRDLSPGNVRRTSASIYKVMDPGFARHTLRTGVTVGGQPGTRGYMSPEHLQSHSGAPTAASDVFGVGILIYQALTGEPPVPWLGDDVDYMRRLGAVQHTPLPTARPDLDAGFAQIVQRCLHRQPARRYRNATELSHALAAIR